MTGCVMVETVVRSCGQMLLAKVAVITPEKLSIAYKTKAKRHGKTQVRSIVTKCRSSHVSGVYYPKELRS